MDTAPLGTSWVNTLPRLLAGPAATAARQTAGPGAPIVRKYCSWADSRVQTANQIGPATGYQSLLCSFRSHIAAVKNGLN